MLKKLGPYRKLIAALVGIPLNVFAVHYATGYPIETSIVVAALVYYVPNTKGEKPDVD